MGLLRNYFYFVLFPFNRILFTRSQEEKCLIMIILYVCMLVLACNRKNETGLDYILQTCCSVRSVS